MKLTDFYSTTKIPVTSVNNKVGDVMLSASDVGAVSKKDVGLVVPIPNYHNVLVGIGEIISYYSNNRNYKWRGWCAVYEHELEQQRAKSK